MRYGGAWCVTAVHYGVLQHYVTTVHDGSALQYYVTVVRYARALRWCVTLSVTTRVMLMHYDSALHCHATIEMMNSLMH